MDKPRTEQTYARRLGVLLWLVGMAGVALVAASFLTPDARADAEQLFSPPLATRALYGGITEELLIRWGLMTLLLWGAWRLWGRDDAAPPARLVWSAIAASALAFGYLHWNTAWKPPCWPRFWRT